MIVSPLSSKLKNMDAALLTAQLLGNLDFPAWNNKRQDICDAFTISSTLHVDSFRKSPRSATNQPPYMEHVLRVALRPFFHYGISDPDVVITGLLHDTVEDEARKFCSMFLGVSQDLSEVEARHDMLEWIMNRFGYRVYSAVSALTNPIPAEGEDKIQSYRNHVKDTVAANKVALTVKISDYIDNAGSLHQTEAPGSPRAIKMVGKYQGLGEIYSTAILGYYNKDITTPIVNRIVRVEESMSDLLV